MPDARVAASVRQLVERDPRPVVLIDGGAGSGKTTLAQQLVATWPGPSGVQLVSLDDLYPGWDGLALASASVPELIVGNGYHSWDWAGDRPGPWRELDPARALIVEGCGAITAGSAALAGLRVWLELDAGERQRRAIARDGADFAAHWNDWAAQESVHWHADHPRDLADLVVVPGD